MTTLESEVLIRQTFPVRPELVPQSLIHNPPCPSAFTSYTCPTGFNPASSTGSDAITGEMEPKTNTKQMTITSIFLITALHVRLLTLF
jgi:hypothetical protein